MRHTPAPLFEPECGKVRADHPATSKQAAVAIGPTLGRQRAMVLNVIRTATNVEWWKHGLTDEEIVNQTGLSPSSVRPRRGELVESGLVRDSGHTRRTRAGRQAIVWRATA